MNENEAEEHVQHNGVKLLSGGEITDLLPLSRYTLYRLRTRQEDPLPSVRIGGKLFYIQHEVERWILRQRRECREA